MDRMKTFAKYAIWVILFWILSDILIYYGINTTYKTISRRNEISNQIAINDAEATKVNGRIKGAVTNTEENNIIGKYIKEERKKAGLTQEEFALRSGLGLRFVRELEQGKETVRLDKENQALAMFGKEAVPGRIEEY